MTSFGHKRIREGNFMPTFKIQGQCYHMIGPLQHEASEAPKYLQIYFMGDSTEQASRRHSVFPATRIEVLGPLQEMLHNVNPYVRQFKTAYDRRRTLGPDQKIVIRADRTPVGEHQRCFNAPVNNETAVLIAAPEGADSRDIVLEWQSAQGQQGIKRITEISPSYDALQYPLLFPYGEDGYTINMPHVDPATRMPHVDPETGEIMTGARYKITQKEFYAYRFMVRPNSEHLTLHRSRDLLNQFVVDVFAKLTIFFSFSDLCWSVTLYTASNTNN